MAVFTIETPDGKVFDIEGDVAPTEAEIQQILADQFGEQTAPMTEVYSAQDLRNTESRRRREKQEAKRAAEERKTDWLADAEAFLGSAASTATWGVGDLAYRGLYGKEAAQREKEIREANPIYSALGTALGFGIGFVAGPLSWAANSVVKAGTRIAGRAAEKKLAQTAMKIGADAVLGEAQFQVQQTAERLAGTRDFAEGNDFLKGAAFSGAADIALRSVGAVGKGIASLISKKQKAIDIMGGAENVKRAQNDYVRALASGRSTDEAQSIFTASLMQGIPEKNRATYESLVQRNPEFAKFTRQQMAGGGEIVIETASALTAPVYKKYSRELLDNLYGPNYKNVLGTTEIDFSKAGLTDLLGLSNEAASMEARRQALLGAEEKVMSNPSLAKQVSDEFAVLTGNLMESGSRDFQRAASAIEPASIKSYAGSEAYQEAVQVADEAINNLAERLAETGQNVTQAQVNDITARAHQAGAQKHFKTIMAEGTSSVQDINDIKEFFKAVDQRAVAAGQAKAFGAFNESVNKQILDGLDSVLYESNQALRYAETLTDMHDFGKKFDQSKNNQLQSLLDNGLSAEERGMKIAAFKMGVLESLNDAVVLGDRESVERIYAMIRSGESLGKYFDIEEVSRYMDAIRPKAEAAHNLNRILTAAGKYRGEQGTLAPAVRLVTGVATGARQQWNNAAITLLQRGLYGKGTARMIEEFSKNPTSTNLNRLIKGTTDLTERQQLNQAIISAFDAVVTPEAAIRGGRELVSER